MIVTLCGSSRFEPWFHMWNDALSLAGHAVFGMSSYPSSHGGNRDWCNDSQMEMLCRAHERKIIASDMILVLNVFTYIGEETLKNIEFAASNSKEIRVLQSWDSGFAIGKHHKEELIRSAEKYGVLGTRSPIDTSSFRDPWYGNLLGHALKDRAFIATMIRDASTAALGYTEPAQAKVAIDEDLTLIRASR